MLLIQSKVSPGRVSMTGPLVTVLVAIAAAVAGEVVRFSADRARAHQWVLIADGHGYDQHALHSADQATQVTSMLRFVLFLAVLFAYQRWVRVGHANAMARTDIGLGWLRALPGGSGVIKTYLLWILSVFASLLVTFVTSINLQTPGDYETAANVDAGYSLVRMVLAVVLGVFVVRLTLGLNKLLATPQSAPTDEPPAELQTLPGH
ncbi:hypothetical protein [Streptomyces sp. NPDC005573]|uniref:hypothetical protein n=1 Tax=Streptomyces sp. NPDC005573 TaxID=3156890 RepID=UPI0033BC7050